MKFSNVRLLVKDFAKCFRFYTEQLGLEPAWEMKIADMPDWGMRTLYLRDLEEELNT